MEEDDIQECNCADNGECSSNCSCANDDNRDAICEGCSSRGNCTKQSECSQLETYEVFDDPDAYKLSKEYIQTVAIYAKRHRAIKDLTNISAILTNHCKFTTEEVAEFSRSNIFKLINSIQSIAIPSRTDYFTGSGPVANYLKEQVLNTKITAIDYYPEAIDRYINERLEEIDSLFNYHPKTDLKSLEYKNVIKTIIDIQSIYLSSPHIENHNLWKPVESIDAITETGLYTVDGRSVVIILMKPSDVPHTLIVYGGENAIMLAHHELEMEHVNIYDVCYFDGTYEALLVEYEKLSKLI